MKTFFQLRDEHIQEENAPLYEEIQKYLEEKLLIRCNESHAGR